MQCRIRSKLFVMLLLILPAPVVCAQWTTPLPAPAMLRQAGLTQAWSTQVEMDRSRARVSGIELYIVGMRDYATYEQTAREIYEVEYEGGIRRYAEFDLDAAGRPLGRAEAHRLAEKAVIQLEARGRKPQLKTRRVPEVALYVQSTNGTLHAIDAENGQTIWAVSIGQPNYPTLRPAANDRHVCVVNGSRLFVLERSNGETVWYRDLSCNPAYGPAMGNTMVFVPGMNGEIEGYWLPTAEDSNDGRPPWVYRSGARISGQPTVTATTCSWPTAAGQMYVAEMADPKVRFRLDTAGPIQGSTAALPPSQLFVTSTDGYVFSVDEVSGEFRWDFSSGEAILQSPVAIGDSVFAVTDHDNLYCLSVADGAEKWLVTHVRGILGASQDCLYVSGRLGEVAVLNRQTGGRLASLPAIGLDVRLVNAQTDRLYLGTREGLLLCLKPIGSEWPSVHVPLPQPPEQTPSEATSSGRPGGAGPASPSAEDQSDMAGEDPFGGSIFGDEAPAAGADDNPFDAGNGQPGGEQPDAGAADDPFGGGTEQNGAGQEDSGAGSDDPFDFG
jgi:outer membrane protein assembly factor BamB